MTKKLGGVFGTIMAEAKSHGSRESSPVSIPGPNQNEEAEKKEAHQKALDAMFARVVPSEYTRCRPLHVPEIASVPRKSDIGACFRGGPGIGKTYAATALAYAVTSRLSCRISVEGKVSWPIPPLVWVSAPELSWRIRGTFNRTGGESGTDIMNECLRSSVMVIDDLGAGKTTEFVCDTFYTIISGRRNAKLYTIVTTNQTLDEIDAWEPRIASRLREMLFVPLPSRDRRLGA